MTTPKNITDLRYENNVINLIQGDNVEANATQFFHESFNPTKTVFVRFLFEQDEKNVFEAYQDSGSDDYLYIIQNKF